MIVSDIIQSIVTALGVDAIGTTNMVVIPAPKKGGAMKQLLFSVFEVDNGYLAEIINSKVVVATTLPEVCTAAVAAAVTNMLATSDDPPPAEDGEGTWLKLNP